MPSFKPGDVVQLKSGGPEMTVKEVSGEPEHVWCVWFLKGEERKGSYPAATLISSDGSSGIG
jgi:uncharacterized protein YodC (DUF2158 family)